MQYLMDEQEFRQKISQARIDGYELACCRAYVIDPDLASKLRERILESGESDALERLFNQLDKAMGR
jgi:hypothetical protein